MNKYILLGVVVLALLIGLYVHSLDSHSVPEAKGRRVTHEAKDRKVTHEAKRFQQGQRDAGGRLETQGAFRPGGVADNPKAAVSATDAKENGQRLERREDTPSVIVQDKAALHSSVATSSDQEVILRSRTDEETDEKTVDQWIVQLSGTDTKARDEALVALKQSTAEEAVPKLKALLEQTEDQQLKAALLETITFIELPEYTPPKNLSTRVPAVSHKAVRAPQ